MGKFHDTLASWTDGFPEDASTQLTAAYEEDFQGAVAATDELNATLASERESNAAEIQRLQAANWELVQKIPTETSGDTQEVENDTEDAAPGGINSLFGDI